MPSVAELLRRLGLLYRWVARYRSTTRVASTATKPIGKLKKKAGPKIIAIPERENVCKAIQNAQYKIIHTMSNGVISGAYRGISKGLHSAQRA